jgi:hypothetical protein
MSYKNSKVTQEQRIQEYMDWANNQSQINTQFSTTTTIKTANGTNRNIHLTHRTKKNKSERIDGHFWIENKKTGKMIYDGGFENYKHHLPCFSDPDFYKEQEGDFYCFQPCRPDLERRVIDEKLMRDMFRDYSKDNIDCVFGETDPRTPDERCLQICQQRWKIGKGEPFNCAENAFCFFILNKDKMPNIRIRFGGACVVRPRHNYCFWFFGHLDNNLYEDWIADISNGEVFRHSRKTKIDECPNALKVINQRVKVVEKAQTRKRKAEENEMEAKACIAHKLMAELLDDEEQKKMKNKNKNKNKNK